MSGKSDKSTHSRTAKDYKNTVKKSLGRSKLSPVQKSGKSDKSTCESPQTTLTITKKHILGKSELSPLKMSGKSDTSIHQPKKKVFKKKKERIEEKSNRSGEPDFEKIPFDPTSHYISPKNKIPNTI